MPTSPLIVFIFPRPKKRKRAKRLKPQKKKAEKV
jgi:hypothetical protein